MGGAGMRAGMVAALLLAAAGAGSAAAPTHADLDAQRRRVALLESELALSRSRKPYLVLDALEVKCREGGRTVAFRLICDNQSRPAPADRTNARGQSR